MDVKSLLNEEESASRPSLQRFGPFKPQSPQQNCRVTAQPQHHRLPPLSAAIPPPQLRSLSYSSTCSSSSSISFSPSESLPSISSRVPPLARSESGGSQSPHSPATPSGTPTSTPLPPIATEPLRCPSNTKAVPFINLPLPRPQIVSTYSFSAAPSGPPSSMDSFATTPNSLVMGDLSFPSSISQTQPYLLSPQTSLTVLPEHQQPSSASPPSSSSHNTSTGPPSSSSKPQKKNSYPCPLARQYACNEFFTTSGHAARHAKKHTGRKDAVCPECSKAFTRKDNMEQHRRTHAKDSAAGASRTASRSSADKDDSKQRKLMRIQQNRKSRPPSLSGSSIASTTPITSSINPVTASSNSSTLTSPIADLSTRTSYPPSAMGSMPMEGTLDPRLRESPSSAASGSVSAFSPTPFTPSVFSMPEATSSIYPPNFNPVFASSSVMPLPQQMPSQQVQPGAVSMGPGQPLPASMSSPESFPHRPHMHRGSYGGNIDYRLQPSPVASPLTNAPEGMDMALGMSIPAHAGLDLGMHPMAMPMDHNLPMSVIGGVDMISAPTIAAGAPLGMVSSSPDLSVGPALNLDKLALAAEAARNNRN